MKAAAGIPVDCNSPATCDDAKTRTAPRRSKSTIRVAVIGGGISGIAAAYYLRRTGISNFTVFEASSDLGGTWFDTRYPGAEIDTPSHLYTFTFSAYDWTHRYATQPEILAYLNKTADQFDLRRHFRFNTLVASVKWSDEGGEYILETASGERRAFDAVISCLGFLNIPLIPKWVDVDASPVPIVHTSRWPSDFVLDGLNIGVVGTGSSAIQVVAEAAKVARNVTIFQRSPNWAMPKGNRAFTPAEREHLREPWRYWLKFAHEYYKYEKIKILGKQDQPGTKTNERMRVIAEAHLHRSLALRPDLIPKLTPDFPFYGKRPLVNDLYYQALQLPNVELAPPVQSMGRDGVRDIEGTTHHVDAIVLATGYEATRYLARLEVKGPLGQDLQKYWNSEPSAYLGCCVPGFPNFFMLYGPNSNAGPVIFMLECQAQFAVANIVDLIRSGARTVEIRQDAFQSYNDWLQSRLESSVFKSTQNYFAAESGRIVTQWPFSATRFWWISWALRRRDMMFVA